MVRIKFRFIAVKFETNKKLVISQESYRKIIYDALYEEYGYKAVCKFYSFKQIDFLPANNIFIFRILRDIYKETILAISKLQKLNSLNVKTEIISVSGSVRGAMKKTKQKIASKITVAQ